NLLQGLVQGAGDLQEHARAHPSREPLLELGLVRFEIRDDGVVVDFAPRILAYNGAVDVVELDLRSGRWRGLEHRPEAKKHRRISGLEPDLLPDDAPRLHVVRRSGEG